MKINAAWHARHRMPKTPSMEQRIRWHLAHAAACACREIPAAIAAELRRRGVAVPKARTRRNEK